MALSLMLALQPAIGAATASDLTSHQTAGPAHGSAAQMPGSNVPSPTLVVRDAWVRWLPGALPAAGYMTLTNTGSRTLSIVGASSPDYGMVMLHRTEHADGHDTMTAIASWPIPAGATVRAAPDAADGYHWMLMQASHPIAVGMRISLHLRLADGSTIVVPMPVSPPTRLR
ncbi:copper chaperone PCu(A)C [Robbsia sp. KACC 23696]|uniref:copper chaperone PCu(A)C n=1 Tax=Robbsia sp. KACC 23696 TaxID=3149231 RepID=UPI00325AE456